eukprot:scaffold11.g3985.t1
MATATAAGAAAAWRFPPTVTPDGQWRIAPLNRTSEDEVRAVVALQTEAFAKATGIQLLDGIERNVFRAEVLSQMRNKLRYGAEDRFVLLVAKARTGSSVLGAQGAQVSGVVEVSLVDDREVLTLLRRADGDGAPEAVPYLASMATSPRVRRQGLARHLLCAAEAIATQWEMQLVLHDNQPAVGLYKASGFEVVDQDGGLLPALRLSRARYLMRKRL